MLAFETGDSFNGHDTAPQADGCHVASAVLCSLLEI